MENGFTLIEVLVLLTIISILLANSIPLAKGYLDYFYFQTAINKLVSDLNWARNQAIANGKNYGIAFSKQQAIYYLISNQESGEIIRQEKISKQDQKIEIKEITLPEYEHEEFSEITHAVFFQELGNLAGHNGRVVIEFEGSKAKEVVYSSNAGELNIRRVDNDE